MLPSLNSRRDVTLIEPLALVASTPDGAPYEAASYWASRKRHRPHVPSAIIESAPRCSP